MLLLPFCWWLKITICRHLKMLRKMCIHTWLSNFFATNNVGNTDIHVAELTLKIRRWNFNWSSRHWCLSLCTLFWPICNQHRSAPLYTGCAETWPNRVEWYKEWQQQGGGAENDGHENARNETDGPICRAWNCRTKRYSIKRDYITMQCVDFKKNYVRTQVRRWSL